MGVLWRILASLLVLRTVWTACPDGLKGVCQCDQFTGGALVVECHRANLSAVMSVLGSDPTTAVAKLSFHDSSIPTLHAKDLGTVNIRSLEISNCNLSTIEAGAFSGLSELEELVLANNSLSKWPPLGGLSKLKAITLNGNALTDVSENAFAGMPNLQQLWLARNQICQLSRNALNETKPSLELLDLSSNCLSGVPAQNLRGASRLQYLDLSSNRISDVPSMQFMNLPLLKEVRLNGNTITRLSAMAFMNVPELQYLFVRDNRISALDSNRLQGFQGFRKLEVLDLTGNLISWVPTASFKEMSSLKQLFLDGNQIERIDTLAFSTDPKLQIISLQNNRLKTLSRNVFDSLDQMVVLLLANNSITDLDRGMFDGMRNLQQLNLRNNSISHIGNGSFDAVPLLTSLDLAFNTLTTIPVSALNSLKDLFWLDLSSNRLQTFTEGTFQSKIANILLDNNPLVCDDQLNWFVLYLVQNNVRTFLPYQQEVVCAAPKEFAGVRLKELMIKKANETFSKSMRSISNTLGGSANPLLGNLLPSLGNLPGLSSGIPGMSPIPGLGTITQAIPSIQNIPGINMLPMDRSENPGLNKAISQIAGPLTRIAEDGSRPPLPSDVNQLLQSIPNLVVNIPGVGDVDLTKLPPGLITHVLNGGSIPGVPQEALNTLVQQHMQRMATAARAAQQGQANEMTNKLLPPLSALDPSVVTAVMQTEKLPGLSVDDTNAIKLYYTQPSPSLRGGAAPAGMPAQTDNANLTLGVPVGIPLPELMKLLPPGFDFSRLPPAILEQASKGQSPDLSLLPPELLSELRRAHPELWTQTAGKVQQQKQTIEDILRNLPSYTRSPNLVTFKPYNINDLDEAQLKAQQDQKDMAQVGLYTAIGLGAVGALTVVVIAVMCYRRRLHSDEEGSSLDVDESELDKTKFFLPKTSSPKSVTAQFDAIGMDNSAVASTVQSAASTQPHHQRGERGAAFAPFDPYTGLPRTAMNGPAPMAWTYGPAHAASSRHHYSRTEI